MSVDENGDLILTPPGTIGDQGTMVGQTKDAIEILRALLSGIRGVLVIALVGWFAYRAFKLAVSESPKQRSEAINGLFKVAIGAAILGGISFIVELVFYALG